MLDAARPEKPRAPRRWQPMGTSRLSSKCRSNSRVPGHMYPRAPTLVRERDGTRSASVRACAYVVACVYARAVWNEAITLDFVPPNNDFTTNNLLAIRDSVHFNLFDEVVISLPKVRVRTPLVVQYRPEPLARTRAHTHCRTIALKARSTSAASAVGWARSLALSARCTKRAASKAPFASCRPTFCSGATLSRKRVRTHARIHIYI